MSETPTPPADPILAIFSQLGIPIWSAGRPDAGLNAFVAMCDVLCVLEGPDAHIFDPRAGLRLPAGVNLLGMDPATNQLIHDLVLRPAHQLQNVWLRRVNAVTTRRTRYSEIRQLRRVDGWDLMETAKRNSDLPLHRLDSDSEYAEPGNLFEEKSHIRKEVAYTSPRFITGSVFPKELGHELGEAHLGHMLVVPQFSNITDVEKLDTLLNAAMSGSFSTSEPGAFSTMTGGQVIATVSDPISKALCDPALCVAIWPSRMLNLPATLTWNRISSGYPTASKPFHTLENYEKALRQVLNDRLHALQRVARSADGLHANHRKVMAEIRRIPGIDRSLVEQSSTLFPTLYHGLSLMVEASGSGWPPGLGREELKMLTLLVVTNAARQLASRRQNALIAFRREEALSVYDKLSEEPLSVRDLVRGFHRSGKARCLEALLWLQSIGLVTQEDRKWRIAGTTDKDPRRVIKTSDLIIDVTAS